MVNCGKPSLGNNLCDYSDKNLDCAKLWWKIVENSANGAKVTKTWIAPNYNGKLWENCSMVAICSPTMIKTWIDPKYGGEGKRREKKSHPGNVPGCFKNVWLAKLPPGSRKMLPRLLK
ncbi:hypothetical protein CDAR_299561 [Caerostris darwini]|uniref:Uncharacterized protein n=1 Tax=Caerostris darwini TaxID=1538125 RepID=A0AAV4RSH3_9ARAC|nr:hypothetical protein CDAR_299561 [Caerostris darwini]